VCRVDKNPYGEICPREASNYYLDILCTEINLKLNFDTRLTSIPVDLKCGEVIVKHSWVRLLSLPLGLSLLTLMSYGAPAQAEALAPTASAPTEAFSSGQLEVATTPVEVEPWVTSAELHPTRLTDLSATQPTAEIDSLEISEQSYSPTASTVSPASSQALMAPTDTSIAQATETEPTMIAQDVLEPGRATRSGPSYIGVGGNIGVSGTTSDLGRGSFAVISKIGLTEFISVRPTVMFDRNATILVPVTFDFVQRQPGVLDAADVDVTVAPYLGAGLAISTGANGTVGPMLSAGIDIPITGQLTANTAINVGFLNTTDVGITLGVGYNFVGF